MRSWLSADSPGCESKSSQSRRPDRSASCADVSSQVEVNRVSKRQVPRHTAPAGWRNLRLDLSTQRGQVAAGKTLAEDLIHDKCTRCEQEIQTSIDAARRVFVAARSECKPHRSFPIHMPCIAPSSFQLRHALALSHLRHVAAALRKSTRAQQIIAAPFYLDFGIRLKCSGGMFKLAG